MTYFILSIFVFLKGPMGPKGDRGALGPQGASVKVFFCQILQYDIMEYKQKGQVYSQIKNYLDTRYHF